MRLPKGTCILYDDRGAGNQACTPGIEYVPPIFPAFDCFLKPTSQRLDAGTPVDLLCVPAVPLPAQPQQTAPGQVLLPADQGRVCQPEEFQ